MMPPPERSVVYRLKGRRASIAIVVVISVLVMESRGQFQPRGSEGQQHFDVLITGGRVLDGTGNPWFDADIGIRAGKIAMVGYSPGATADRTIDARGKYIAPGFIDMHSHADDGGAVHGLRDSSAIYRAAPNLVSQGITTVVVNPDGYSPWPIAKQRMDMEHAKIGPNAVLMVGHNSIRQLVMGDDSHRVATLAEIEKMRAMVHRGMEEGAFGITAGLEYPPGIWSNTDELVSLVREIVPFDGLYAEHERSSGDAPMWWKPSRDTAAPVSLLDSVQETLDIGERTGARVLLSHVHARGINSWGASRTIIELVDQARQRGVEVWADQYPYNSSGSDGDLVLIPAWAIGEGKGAQTKHNYSSTLRETMADASALDRLRLDIAHAIEFRGGAENIVVLEYSDSQQVGKTLAQLARSRHIAPVEMVITFQLEGSQDHPGGVRLRSFSFSEEDVESLMAQPWVATSTDAGISLSGDGGNGEEVVHPRYYGTFPRKIRHYVLDRRTLSLENAVRSSTSLPAQILGLHDRGLIREGLAADIVMLDLTRIRDRATFTDPYQYSEGVDDVMVNGTFVVDEGKVTGALPGLVLTRLREK